LLAVKASKGFAAQDTFGQRGPPNNNNSDRKLEDGRLQIPTDAPASWDQTYERKPHEAKLIDPRRSPMGT